jgi:hypothetical protein
MGKVVGEYFETTEELSFLGFVLCVVVATLHA